MEREIEIYKNYFPKFFKKLHKGEKKKVNWAIDKLKRKEEFNLQKLALPVKNIKGVYELRTQFGNNALRVYYVYENKKVVILFNGIKKKDEKITKKDLEKIKLIKKDYETDKKY